MCVHATHAGLLSSVQDGGHTALFPELYSCHNSMGTLGLLCGCLSCSQHPGCPATPPSLGAAGRCYYPGGVCTAVRASRVDLLSLLTIPIPRAADLLPASRNPEPLEAEAAAPSDPCTQGLMLIKRSPGADN